MGKQRIAQLLNQLESDQQKDLKNSAAIYAVAQVAVNQLAATQKTDPSSQSSESRSLRASLPSPSGLDKVELLRRYGSYNECRKAAKNLGIQFRITPSWQQLSQAFSYAEALQHFTDNYIDTYPSVALEGVTVRLRLSA
jgi:hypothetical protein